jgi:hypothetical protein
MVTDRKKDNRKTPVKQGPQDGVSTVFRNVPMFGSLEVSPFFSC